MAIRLELEDLPPRYREQAQRQIAQREERRQKERNKTPGGVIEAVEIKSRFTRKAQRDYIYRRRLFIDLVAEPRGWKFTEYIAGGEKE